MESEKISTLKLFKWGMCFVFLTLVIASIILYRRGNSELRQYVLKILEAKYPELQVKLAHVQLVEMHGVRLHNLRLSLPNGPLLLQIDEMYIECPITIKKFLKGELTPTRITLRYPTFYLQDRHRLKEELLRIRPVEDHRDRFPVIAHDGRIIVSGDKESSCFSGVQLELNPVYIKASDPADWTCRGRLSNPFVLNVDFEGAMGANNSDWSFSGTARELEVNRELMEQLGLSDKHVQNFQGRTSFTFMVKKEARAPQGFQLQLDGELFRGSGSLEFLKYPLSNLYVKYHLDEKGLRIERCTGRSGPIMILADFWQDGFLNSQNGQLRIQLEEFPLDSVVLKQLDGFLSDKVRDILDDYDFSMVAKVNLVLQKDKEGWKPRQLGLLCRQGEGLWRRFPYRMEQLQGFIVLDEKENLHFQFTSGNEEIQKVSITGHYANVLSQISGRVEIQGSGHSLDNKLFRAMPQEFRTILESLHPKGYVDAHLIIDKKANVKKVESEFCINVRDAMAQFDRFPLPVANINGQIRYKQGVWSFDNLQGTGRSALVKASGLFTPAAEESSNHKLLLQLDFEGLPLGEDLENALVHFPQKELIEKLNLKGKANAQARIRYESQTKDFELEFEARPIPAITSIKPDLFPYELKNLDGLVVYRKGEIIVDNIRGRNGQAVHQAGMRCHFDSDGSWSIDVQPLVADQVRLDHELQLAVPPAVLSFLESMRVQGYFNFTGALHFSRKAGNAPLEAAWDIGLVLQQNNIRTKIPVNNICGKMQIRGCYLENNPLQIHGELDIDSLCLNDVQITKLTGPFYYDGKNITFGKTVPHPSELAIYLNDFLRQRLYSDPQFQQINPMMPVQQAQTSGFIRGQMINQNGNNKPITPPVNSATSITSIPVFPLSSPQTSLQNQTTSVQTTSVQTTSAQTTSAQTVYSPPQRIATLQQPMSSPKQITSPIQVASPQHVTGINRLGGTKLSDAPDVSRRAIQGRFFKGPTQFNGIIFLEDHVSYRMGIAVQDADLQEALRELAKGGLNYQGKISLYANFQGESSNLATLKGEGNLVVREAALYEMPMILKILQSLSIQKVDQTAFNSGQVAFQSFGNRVNLDNVVLQGRALTVFGNGQLTLEENENYIELKMNSRLGGSQQTMPVLSEVIGGAGDQLAQICVEGSLTDPTIWAERFPGIKKAWWKFFSKEENPSSIKMKNQK